MDYKIDGPSGPNGSQPGFVPEQSGNRKLDFDARRGESQADLAQRRPRLVYDVVEANGGKPVATNLPRNLRRGR